MRDEPIERTAVPPSSEKRLDRRGAGADNPHGGGWMLSELGTAARARLGAVWDRLAKERGATAVEYSLLVALIAAVIVVAVAVLGGHVSSLYSSTASTYP